MVMMMTLMVTEIMKIMAMGDNYEYGNGGWHNFAAVVNMAVLVNMLAQRLLGKYSVSRHGLVKIATLVMITMMMMMMMLMTMMVMMLMMMLMTMMMMCYHLQ